MKKLHKLNQVKDRALLFFAFLPMTVTRLVLAFGFHTTGVGKIKNLDNVINFFTSLNIPYPAQQAWFVARLEYYGAWLLLLGLATRPTAFLLACTMIVALLTADNEDFAVSWTAASDKLPVEITAFAYLVLLSWLLVYGAGILSLDAICAAIFNKLLGKSDEEK